MPSLDFVAMPHLGGKQSTLSSALGNVNRQLKSGKTRGTNPRNLEPDEIAALQQKRDSSTAEMKQRAQERATSFITGVCFPTHSRAG